MKLLSFLWDDDHTGKSPSCILSLRITGQAKRSIKVTLIHLQIRTQGQSKWLQLRMWWLGWCMTVLCGFGTDGLASWWSNRARTNTTELGLSRRQCQAQLPTTIPTASKRWRAWSKWTFPCRTSLVFSLPSPHSSALLEGRSAGTPPIIRQSRLPRWPARRCSGFWTRCPGWWQWGKTQWRWGRKFPS